MQALMRSAGLTEDAEARLVAAAQAMAAAVFPDPAGQLEGPLAALEQSTVAARRVEGLKLYWRTLEGLVAAEAARPDATPGSGASLLAAPTFHRCVAACAFELVAAAYRVGTLAFPAVLERLHLPAFELCKVLEPCVQQVPSLPRDLKRHLLSVEEQCLESLAWLPGSSLYTCLMAAVGIPAGGSSGRRGDGGVNSAAASDVGGAARAEEGPSSGQPEPSAPQQQQQEQQEQQQRGQRQGGSPAHSKGDSSAREATAGGAAEGSEERADAAGTAGAAGAAADAMSAGDGMADASASQAPPPADTHCAEGKLPLFLGHEPPAAPAAAAGGGEQQAQQAAAAAAGQHAAEIARGDRGSRAAVAELLRRVLKLCAIRLADLLSRLDCRPADPQLLLAEAYTLAQHVCFEQSWLLYGRHLDQALLCCLYSICKVHHLGQASFKSIIAAYKQQPQARSDTFKRVSMTPRERTSLHSMGGPPHADIIAFYNQVFLPHTKPFLLRLAESRSLLAQPPASVLPYLLATHGQQQQHQHHHPPNGSVTPPPPVALLRGMQPASLQHTPFRPGALAGGSGWPSPAPPPLHPHARGLLSTPTRGSGGAAARSLQLRSPGAWRISRGQMTPILPSPQLMSLTPGFSPGGLHPGFLHGAPPLSMAAIHSMFGLPGGGGGPAAPAPTLPALPSKAAELPPIPAALPAAPQPLVSDAAVQAMFASAEAAAAAAAAAGAAGAAAEPAGPPPSAAALDAADIEELHQLSALPSESLPLLAAAAAVAEEIEQREREVAEAFNRRAAQLSGAAVAIPAAAAAGHPEQAQPEAEGPEAPQPGLQQQQQQQQPMLSPARHARRVLSLQPAAPPVQ
jgi:retinoblastoma-like protein 1